MNTLNLIARLTREPETKYTPNGKAITSFGIAYDMGFGDNKRACFLDCKLWGDRGETFAKYVQKGHSVALTGSLDMESWQDKQTQQKRSKNVMEVRDFTLLNNKRDGDHSDQRQAPAQQRQQPQPARRPPQRQDDDFGEAPITPMEDDDIPF